MVLELAFLVGALPDLAGQGKLALFYWNETDLAEINPRERYRQVALVFQDVKVFAFSLAENICFRSREERDEARLQQALKEAGLSDLVASLPQGVESLMVPHVNPGGISLSGGQNQRLMLARALYKGGNLLILDEPTSALDPLAEAELYRDYHRFTTNKTAIFISHRLSSTQFCDRVLFLQEGRLVQDGSHAELMAEGGPYRELFEVQARYYRSADGQQPGEGRTAEVQPC